MKLVVLDGELKGQEFPLEEPLTTLGRRDDVGIPIPYDGGISRLHCQILQDGAEFYLEDLGSANGTWVGQDRVEGRRPLEPNTVIRLGKTRLCFMEDQGSGPEAVHSAAKPTVPTPGPDEPTAQPGQAPSPKDTFAITGVANPLDVWHQTNKIASKEELQQRLQAFQDVSAALAGKVEIKEFLQAVLKSVVNVLPAERAFVFRAGAGLEELIPLATWPASAEEGQPVVVSRTLLNRVFSEGVATLIQDVQSDFELNARKSIQISEIRSAMCVPLRTEDGVKAILHLDASSAHAFTQPDLELLTAIANQAALALTSSELYDQLKQTQDQLIQTEKLSTIGTLAASVAHDVRNVLTPISMVSSKVLGMEGIDPRMKEVFERQIQRLRALSQQLLSFSRGDATLLEPVEINRGIQESVNLVQTEARHAGSEISSELASDLPMVRGDLNRLDQVFVNLMINAVQAMEPNGGGSVRVRSYLEDGHVVVALADDGPGIPPDTLARIFQPFFTTKGAQGNGLGLFSCKRIVEEEHRGSLSVESEVGTGTTFYIRLPVT